MILFPLLDGKLESYIICLLAKIPFVLIADRLLVFRNRIFYSNRENSILPNNLAD